MDGHTIRPATPEDIDEVRSLWSAAGTHPTVTDTPGDLLQLLHDQPEALLVAEVDGALAGSLIATWDGWRGNLYRLAVRHDHRRRGLGRALVLEAARRLRERGARRVSLYVVAADEPALVFWESLRSWGLIPDPSPKARFIWNLEEPRGPGEPPPNTPPGGEGIRRRSLSGRPGR
jgi:ribosomal protein S18 acetylase RimI-like enzyme